MKTSTNQPAVTSEQLDEWIARDEVAKWWEMSFQLKHFALLELRARRNNAGSGQLTSFRRALTDSQLDYVIRIGRRNVQVDPESGDYHLRLLEALKELRALRRRCMDSRGQSRTMRQRQPDERKSVRR